MLSGFSSRRRQRRDRFPVVFHSAFSPLVTGEFFRESVRS